jgi:hypothetical protein
MSTLAFPRKRTVRLVVQLFVLAVFVTASFVLRGI